MTGRMSVMNAIKRAVSPLRPSLTTATDAGPSSPPALSSLTDFVLNRLQGPSKQLFALSFAAQMSVDKHALVFDLADALPWLGIDILGNAVRLMTKHFKEGEYRTEEVFLSKDKNPKGGRPGKRYLISLDMFEDLLMLADTKQGRDARKMYKQLRDAVQDFMKMEMEESARAAAENEKLAQLQLEDQASKLAKAEQDKAALSSQLKNLRDAKSYLYAFHLFDNRYKCGITDNPVKRERQHQTSCPSGRMVHTVVIAYKQSEKLMDSIMKRHGAHVRQEEYEIEEGEERVRVVFDTIARVEESLHSVPFDRYDELLLAANAILSGSGDELEQSVPIPTPPVADPVIGPFSNSGSTGRGLDTILQEYIRDRCDIGASYGVHTDHFLEEFNRANPRMLLRSQTLSKSMDKMGFMPSKHVVIDGRERRGYRGLRMRTLP